jgi:uncharacterized protein YkwD
MRVTLVLAVGACLLGGCAGPAPRQEPLPQIATPSLDKLASPNSDAPELEQAVHLTVNRMRRKHGRKPLAWSDTLHQVARKHSQDMAERAYFSHTTPEGDGPVERAKRLDFPPPEALEDGPRIGVGENLFRGGLYEQGEARDVARETVESWMESPLHRKVLLNPLFRQQGLGVALIDGKIYVTQNLF